MRKPLFILSTLLLVAVYSIKAQVTYSTPTATRTEARSDAGLAGAGAKSGFFETQTPVNYPQGATGWWHLLDVRHDNPTLNYAMQFAGSIFNQELYFRKTNNSATTPWKRVVMGSYGVLGNSVGNTLELLDVDATPGGGNNSFLKVLLRRHTAGTGWLNASTRIQAVTDASNQGFIDFNPLGLQFGLSLGVTNGVNNLQALNINSAGNVGIGTTNPGSFKLAVEGKIGAREIQVTAANPWPDYVFHKSYKLLPLAQLETYINQNKHLPNIPSAQEVNEKGINLGEMDAKLLEKIEELTLYVVELKKENDLIKEQIKKMSGK